MNKELAKTIGAAARQARNALSITQEDAAERAGINTDFYSRIERGTSMPSVATLTRMMHSLGVSADAMLGRDQRVITRDALRVPMGVEETTEIRRLLRRIRKATPRARRIVSMLLKELETV